MGEVAHLRHMFKKASYNLHDLSLFETAPEPPSLAAPAASNNSENSSADANKESMSSLPFFVLP